jgi:hypothetical protein
MIRLLAFICLCVGVYAHSGDIGGRSPPGQDPLTPHCSFSLCALCWFLGELHWLSYEAFSIPQARLSFFFVLVIVPSTLSCNVLIHCFLLSAFLCLMCGCLYAPSLIQGHGGRRHLRYQRWPIASVWVCHHRGHPAGAHPICPTRLPV